MKTICIVIGLLCIYSSMIMLAHPSGMHHALQKIALTSTQGNIR